MSEGAAHFGLQLGDLGRVLALNHYAAGVAAREEKTSNRWWQEYEDKVRTLATCLVHQAYREVGEILQ